MLCLLGLGANLGDARQALAAAAEQLAATPGFDLLRASRVVHTRPAGGPRQPDYLNQALLGHWSRSPDSLLQAASDIERRLGRVRELRWGPRRIDIDLLACDQIVSHSPRLTLPHPRFAVRQFALLPAAAIAPHFRHPLLGVSLAKLQRRLAGARELLLLGPDADAGRHWERQLEQAARAAGIRVTYSSQPQPQRQAVTALLQPVEQLYSADPGPLCRAALRSGWPLAPVAVDDPRRAADELAGMLTAAWDRPADGP
jgi:2-amino-4-hydroxy-6-hydroxymethyldihydropteridine diphosphokinase